MKEKSFLYMGKYYKWIDTFQGVIDCTCPTCQRFVDNLVKTGKLSLENKEPGD